MSSSQQEYNRELAKHRIYIGHVIRSLKIFRILAQPYRNRRRRFGLRFNLIAGLYNYGVDLAIFFEIREAVRLIHARGLIDNSSITANGVKGRGGNISITTQGIFQEPDSSIMAASELGIDGTITINNPDVDPTSEVFQLSDVPIDTEAILAQNLCRFEEEKIAKGSSFIVSRRGGLTPTSEESLGNVDNVVRWANRGDLDVSKSGVVGVRQRDKSDVLEKNHPVVQQSQGWVTTADGAVWLVANAPQVSPQNRIIVHPSCISQ